MKMYWRGNKGFTLIELLVVVAIISLLSSVVFASLNGARLKAKDAAIKEGIAQWVTLMALNYNDYGSYCQLQSGWHNVNGTCDASFSVGNYTIQARAICNNIFNNAKDSQIPTGGYRIYSTTIPTIGCSTAYSFMVFLNNNKWYCSGSSGAKGEYANYDLQPGCYNNP